MFVNNTFSTLQTLHLCTVYYLECILISEDFHQALNTSFDYKIHFVNLQHACANLKGFFLLKNSIKTIQGFLIYKKVRITLIMANLIDTHQAKSLTPHGKIPPKVSIN